MANYKSLAEIEQDVQRAQTAEDIGDIFRDVFACGTRGFTERSIIAVDALYAALERLSKKAGMPSAIELRDLSCTMSTASQTS